MSLCRSVVVFVKAVVFGVRCCSFFITRKHFLHRTMKRKSGFRDQPLTNGSNWMLDLKIKSWPKDGAQRVSD